MWSIVLVVVSSFCVVFSSMSADFTGSRPGSVSIPIEPVTVVVTENTSLSSEYSTDHYRNRNRRVFRRPVTRRPTNNRRPAVNNRRPGQTKVPVDWQQSDTCGGNILIPLSDDQKHALIEETYQSTGFPVSRTYPLICSWNVKVSENCRHALLVLRIDERSRLPNEKECNKGYFRVSPFMHQAKMCGRIGAVPPLQWHVEQHPQPETVTITMRNPGLEDEKVTGFSFSLQGECLPYEWNVTTNSSVDTNSSLWLRRIWKDSAAKNGPTVVVPGVDLSSLIPWMEIQANDFIQQLMSSNSSSIPGTRPPITILEAVTGEANINRPPPPPHTRRPGTNRVRTRPTRRPNIRRPMTMRPIHTRPSPTRPISWHQYDTCGGVVHVPLLFDRLSFYESSHFFSGRKFPLVCTWSVKVNPLCRRARVTMRVDVRSRLADVEGCTRGYYTVSPLMKGARLCGRIGSVPPFQWHVDEEKPKDVAVWMENIGLDDSRPEGISFSLQSECIAIKSSSKHIVDVDIANDWSNSRWMSRVAEQFSKGDGPRLVTRATSSVVENENGTEKPSTDPVGLGLPSSHTDSEFVTSKPMAAWTIASASLQIGTSTPPTASSATTMGPLTRMTRKKSTLASPSTAKKPTTRPGWLRYSTMHPCTDSLSIERPPSTTNSPTRANVSTTSRPKLESDLAIQEAISYLSSQLEETKKRHHHLPSSEEEQWSNVSVS